MSKKEKFPLYLSPEKKAILERRYQEDGSRSITAFIERAVDFYLDYLSANNAGLFLPTSIKPYLDGRMGQLEGAGCPPSPSGRRWSRTWWPVSSPTRISSAARILRRRRDGERSKCTENQWPHLAGATGA